MSSKNQPEILPVAVDEFSRFHTAKAFGGYAHLQCPNEQSARRPYLEVFHFPSFHLSLSLANDAVADSAWPLSDKKWG